MTEQVTTLVLVRVGCCGPVSFEDGVLVNLPAEVADALVGSGDAVPVGRVDAGTDAGGADAPRPRGHLLPRGLGAGARR